MTQWEPLTMSAQTETQQLIVKTIGITEATFAHSVFAAQGAAHFADPSLPPRERKAILAEALALGTWEELLKLVKADMAEIQTEADVLTARLGAFEQDLAERETLEAKHAELVAAAAAVSKALVKAEASEAQVREAHDAERALEDRRALLASAVLAAEGHARALEQQADVAEMAKLEAVEGRLSLPPLRVLAATAETLESEAQGLANAGATRAEAVARRDGLLAQAEMATVAREKAQEERAQMQAKIVTLSAEIAAIMAGERHCDRCEQPLLGEAREKAVASVRRDIAALEARSEELALESDSYTETAHRLESQAALIAIPELLGEDVLEENRSRLRAARTAVADLAVLRERIATAERAATLPVVFPQQLKVARLAQANAEQALAAVPPTDPERSAEVAQALARAVAALTMARTAERDAQTALATSAERLRSLAVLAERSQEAVAARAGLQGRLEVLAALARSYGRDGIPALILEASAIPQLETEANRILAQLDARFRFELVTQRENKGGGLKDTLDVVVHGEQGALRYESYSGGEQTRLAFALRLALARLIASRRSAQAGVLILDELAFLDGSGIAKVCEVLRGLSEFRSILLVSHDDRFVDAFDNVVSIVRDERGSRLEVAA